MRPQRTARHLRHRRAGWGACTFRNHGARTHAPTFAGNGRFKPVI